MIADDPADVRKRVREQLMLGASQIKLAAGGGVASEYDPIDVSQYTEAEFRAAVEAAEIGALTSRCTPIRPAPSGRPLREASSA